MSQINMTQLEGGLRSSGGAHIERIRKATDAQRVRREINWSAVNAANKAERDAYVQKIETEKQIQEAGFVLTSSWSWGCEYYMPSFDGVNLIDKPTSNKQEAIAACLDVLEALEDGDPENNDVINLTQHTATVEQSAAGVVEPENKAAIQAALTFDAIPTAGEMRQRASLLAAIAKDNGCKKAMIGGAPFFMATLERALVDAGITPVYAFSVRDSREEPDGNGGVRKVNVFRHVGFIDAVQ